MIEEFDLRGLKCPLPALKAEKRLGRIPAGEMIAILADDPLAPLDIEHLCRRDGHDLLSRTGDAHVGWRFVIRRGQAASG